MTTWNPRANELFLKALELRGPVERRQYLDEACANDAALRAEVESLLAASARAGHFLESPVVGLAATAGEVRVGVRATATVDEPQLVERPGTVIGPYKLLEQIGEGGFGVVFMAEQTDPVRRKVALKVLKPGMDTGQVVARFEAERQALALMDHPNIAHILDGGATASGRPYFVMELVKGIPITAFCDQNHLPVRARMELFVSVCQAVQHAHHKGIIHRDIKPSNVLVTVHDTTPVVKVIDFGVAKALGQELTDRTLFTGFAQMIGTPLYMSPEQAGQSGLDIDTRSDIYALGVLLYELLTGTTPFARERFKEVSYDELRRIIREEEPPKPSTRISTLGQVATSISTQRKSDPKRLSALLRGELDWVVMKALEKDRSRRYESASAFAADVERYLHDEPVLACPPSVAYRVRKFAKRNRTALVMVAALALAVLVAAASIGWMLRDREARAAEDELRETARLAEVARQAGASLNTARTLMAENKPVSASQQLAKARTQLGQDAAALPRLAADIHALAAALNRFTQFQELMDLGYQAETTPTAASAVAAGDKEPTALLPVARNWERHSARAVPFLLKALALYGVLERADWTTSLEGGLLGKDQVQQIRRGAYEALLWLADDSGRRQQEHPSGRQLAPKLAVEQALVYLARAETAHPPTTAFYVLAAKCQQVLGGKEATRANQQLAATTQPTMAVDHFLRGQDAYYIKDKATAIREFQAALHLEPSHYWSLMLLGYCLTDLGQGPEDFTAGVVAFTGCVLKRPEHAYAYYCRGLASEKLSHYDEALADFSKAIVLEPKLAPAWCSRGSVYATLGQLDRALADLNDAIKLDPKLARSWNNRSNVYLKLSRPDRALADLNEAIEVDPKYAQAWANRAMVHRKLGQPDKALADYTKAIALDSKFVLAWYYRGVLRFEELHQYDKAAADFTMAAKLAPKNAAPWQSRGMAHQALGQLEKALADFTRALDLDSTLVQAWYDRGILYRKLGQSDKALADYTQVIKLNPKHAMAWTNRGIIYGEQRQFERALADFTQAIEADPKLVLAWYNRASLFADDLHQYDKALADFTRAVELDPKMQKAWFNRAGVHDKLGQPDKALDDYSQAIELQPKHAMAWFNRGMIYVQLRQYEKGLADWNRSIELDPTFAPAWSNRGTLHVFLRQPDKALDDLNKALALNPKLVQAWYNRGLVHAEHLGQYDKAVADFIKAAEVDPQYVLAWNNAAWVLANCPDPKVRDPGRAVELARKAVAVGSKTARCWNTLGWACYRAGDSKIALDALEKSVGLKMGADGFDLFLKAMAHWQLGDKEDARKWYEKAVAWMDKYEPQNNDLRRFRAEAAQLLGVLETKDQRGHHP
jgi:tetratricopeptide (TPR) repeat protein/serine/threonine protein kinase